MPRLIINSSYLFSILLVILLAQPIFAKTGILLVAFGSSVPGAEKAYAAIEKEWREAFPDSPMVWAWTSQKIRKKMQKSGKDALGIAQGLDQLAKDGADTVFIQSLHMTAGQEFSGLARSALLYVSKNPKKFNAVYLGRPLLESADDAQKVIAAALDDLKSERKPDEAIIFMAHGNPTGRSDLILEGAAGIFKETDRLVYLGGVEGAKNIDDIIKQLKSQNISKVWLAPLMVVAGDHAHNDMAGADADSWANKLRNAGFDVSINLKGLGEIPGIAEIFIEHSRENNDDLTKEPIKP